MFGNLAAPIFTAAIFTSALLILMHILEQRIQ